MCLSVAVSVSKELEKLFADSEYFSQQCLIALEEGRALVVAVLSKRGCQAGAEELDTEILKRVESANALGCGVLSVCAAVITASEWTQQNGLLDMSSQLDRRSIKRKFGCLADRMLSGDQDPSSPVIYHYD